MFSAKRAYGRAVTHDERHGQGLPRAPAVEEVELMTSSLVQRRAVDHLAEVVLSVRQERVQRAHDLLPDHLNDGRANLVLSEF